VSFIPIQYRLAALLVAFLTWSGFCWWKGHSSAMATWEATQAKADKLALQATLDMERKGAQETVRYVTQTRVIHDHIQSEPPVVTREDDSRCVLPADFAGVWNRLNAATADAPADSHAGPDSAVVTRAEAGRRDAATVGH